MNAGADAHPIQVVARRTGLTADVIRIWERRYAAVSPERTATGRRLYSNADVDRLLLLRQATEAGRRIGDVAGLSTEKLRALVAGDRQTPVPTAGRRARHADGGAGGYLQSCLEAVDRMDPEALQRTLDNAAVSLTLPVLLDQLITPMLRHIGEHWQAGTLRIGQEHLAASVTRSFLGRLSRTSNMDGTGPTLVVTTPVGQNHELGALMAAITAGSEGWNVVHLNPNTPADEIAASALATKARAVALSMVYPPDDPRIQDELRALRRHLPPELKLLVGGAASDAYKSVLQEVGAVRLETLSELRTELQTLRNG
ncbi:MAG: MerR family transcriptional regulator [Gammaproteobacteria bacterium]